MKNSFKLITFNIFIFIFLVILIELIFGNWLKSENFGFSIRELRNVNIPMSVKYDQKKYDYNFKRNNYGFIGEEINPKDIKIVFMGGSTGEEMFKPYEYSIVGLLNSKFKEDEINIKITNASKGGKSTRGYVNDFLYWFPKIKDFNPNTYIFYTGLNDSSLSLPDHYDQVIKENTYSKLEDYIKNNSIFYEFKKKIELKYFSKIRKYYGLEEKNLYDNFELINYKAAMLKFSKKKIDDEMLIKIENFSKNLENLKYIIDKKRLNPIFITQIQYNGIDNHSLFVINEYLKDFCKKNNYKIIKLDEMNFKLDDKDFYDHVHTTVKGSKKISNLIYSDLKKYLKVKN